MNHIIPVCSPLPKQSLDANESVQSGCLAAVNVCILSGCRSFSQKKNFSWLWLFSVYNFSSQLHLIAVLGNYSCFRGNCCWVRKYSSGFPSIQSKLHDATGVLLYLWRNSTFKTYPSIQENCHPWTGDADCSCKIGLIANSIGFRTFLIRKKYHQRSLFTSLVPVFGWVAASWRSLWNSVS